LLVVHNLEGFKTDGAISTADASSTDSHIQQAAVAAAATREILPPKFADFKFFFLAFLYFSSQHTRSVLFASEKSYFIALHTLLCCVCVCVQFNS